ncbi:S8 family serine peptidase [Persicobacter sp. CCB-QB2]|uniref:S8 family serine peptidase n=1 Tax=Persicobacter sp. CCB-QB2 TaxID=1561025 RepID=UPI0006A95BC7|nr:S8 family serine peptidase [Persicobacter sp. CCB-QB2]
MRLFSFFLFLLFTIPCQAQELKYWVFFQDKNISFQDSSSYLDHPLSEQYLQALKKWEVQEICRSKWLNGITAILDSSQISSLQQEDFIKEIVPVSPGIVIASGERNLAREKAQYAFNQMEGQAFTDKGLDGRGVKIGLIDAGYIDANVKPSLKHVFDNNQVIMGRDFINKWKKDLYQSPETFQDWHGTEVFECTAGIFEKGSQPKGFAPGADYYLARTDHGDREFRGEEDYWIAALEWMDSLGVKLVNSSLGYARGYDRAEENYRPSDMDGKTTIISRAAEIAANQKGMFLVISAGNEGNELDWRVVSAPADARSVFSVGASHYHLPRKYEYSAQGPKILPYIKPDVVCYASSGTSFSAPIITGLVACIMQYQPDLSHEEIKNIIKASANLYKAPNNYVGVGIPNCRRILALCQGEQAEFPFESLGANGDLAKVPTIAEEVLIFHKSDDRIVEQQVIKKGKKKGISLKRPKGIKRSTVVTKEKVIELIWLSYQ